MHVDALGSRSMTSNLLSRLVALRKISRELGDEIARVKKELALDCCHPETDQALIPWEHDNGYGVQKWFCGYRCDICNHYLHTYEPYAKV